MVFEAREESIVPGSGLSYVDDLFIAIQNINRNLIAEVGWRALSVLARDPKQTAGSEAVIAVDQREWFAT